ncbi:hypothetical protein SASPL_105014 [Salvia splendens]|uniref:Uncharacterized protein n=1 Tax=Salvia splendens TaxID=180675 RepID=A0A8X8YNU6_SALSN|nr:hypothetical protein SASPL_105014 [Salvia splendens]
MEKQCLHRLLTSPQISLLQFSFSISHSLKNQPPTLHSAASGSRRAHSRRTAPPPSALASDAVPAAIPCRTRSRYCHRRRTLTAAGSLSAASLSPSLCSARHRAVGWRWSPPPFHSSLPALVIAVATAEESARLSSWLSLCRRSWGSPSA